MVIRVIEKAASNWDQAYNIAAHAVVTLKEFITQMAEKMQVDLGKTDPNDNNLFMYPTVYS